MSDSCPLPIDWLDYLEGEESAEMTEHLRDCPSCGEVLSALRRQPGEAPSAAWVERLTGLEDARLVEHRGLDPAPAEIWFSAGRWTFHDTEYLPPKRSLVLVLSGAPQEAEDLSWYDVAPLRTDVEDALPTDFLLTPGESTLECPLRVVLSFECKVERRQLESRVGSLADPDVVIAALSDQEGTWRWGNPLESPEDPRLWWEPSFSATIEALRGPWLQYLDSEKRADDDSLPSVEGEILSFVPREWAGEADERELVAASSGEQKGTLWELGGPGLQMAGSFDVDWEREALFFSIHRCLAERPLRLRLVLYLKGGEEPQESEEFEPVQDGCVFWELAKGPEEVDRLGARVVG